MMWTAIESVSSLVTLVAFVVAVFAYSIRNKALQRKKLIETAPESERAALIDKTLEFFDVDTSSLSQPKKLGIALAQIKARAQRFLITAIVITIIAFLAAIVLIANLLANRDAPSPVARVTVTPEYNNSKVLHNGDSIFVNEPVNVLVSGADDSYANSLRIECNGNATLERVVTYHYKLTANSPGEIEIFVEIPPLDFEDRRHLTAKHRL